MSERPSVFVGSSGEGLEIARAIQYQLNDVALVTVWNEGVFGLSEGTLEALVRALDRFDFAILVITPDDLVTSRGHERQAPRDNVMFELGLFMGRLGPARTFALCSDSPELKLPSDLAGVTMARFKVDDAARDLTAALGPSCFRVRQVIRDLGLSPVKKLTGVAASASHVEQVSDRAGRLIALLARSRVLELEVIRKQFGSVLPQDFIAQLHQDLVELEEATGRTARGT